MKVLSRKGFMPRMGYVLGYGSLMNVASATQTIRFRHKLNIKVNGWKRAFNVIGLNNGWYTSPIGTKLMLDGIPLIPNFNHVYMGVVEDDKSSITCAGYLCDRESLERFRSREGLYDIVDVSDMVDGDLKYPVLLAVPKNYKKDKNIVSRITRQYWDTCESGAIDMGIHEEFITQCGTVKDNNVFDQNNCDYYNRLEEV